MHTITINKKIVGGENSSLIIAELSGNHLQKFDLAVETLKAIKEAGADAVKLQTYTPDTITIDVDNEYFQITDIPLIEYIASKGKPVIISTGIARLCDIEEAVNACRRMGNNQIALLKCTSAYPAPVEEINLNTIPNL